MRRHVAIGLTVMAMLSVGILGACSSEGDDTASTPTGTSEVGTETATATPSVTTTVEASQTPGVAATPFAGEEDIQYAEVTPDIAGLSSHTDSNQGEPYKYFETWPTLEGFPVLADEAGSQVTSWRQSFEEQFGPPPAGSPIVQEFNASYSFIVASGDVIGIRFQVYEFPGAGGVNLSHTLWFDLQSGEAVPSTALLDGDAALQQVSDLAIEALKRDRPDLNIPGGIEDGASPTDEHYHSLGFTPDGDLIVEFDEYQVGPGSSGSPRVLIPADVVAPLLSDFGRRAQAEVMSPSDSLDLPDTTAAVTPSATTPPTGGVDCSVEACIALTFDDGPSGPTTELLDLLRDRGVHVTFFVVGVNATYQPSTVARAAAEGHEIGNHTFDHRDLTMLSKELITDQITRTSDVIEAATGKRPTLLRPPYGATDDKVAATAGMPLILWSIDPRDWADHDSQLVTQRVLDAASRGDIVLLHDIHETSVQAVPAILDGLAERGLVPVTVSELLGSDLVAGQSYRRAS
ncbi:MAG: polysaccharide deacetylase family protein [Dehalococcoidia bacterium]|nr:polysaccharide deacetylase family protein [Dehalococcoidia bacterium]MCB9491897.1 polysaccharide deacetylase family protein [Dehalococcoidia bacterium]